ncbi:hypothetical protein [uncultured Mucilaginibacter sp.]|uniref:hypothetical protein n=1 Tax=uncultured Mucilaginibacter sp. TaxID=797541 RepID=UPI002610A09F|nr:hypothetical protein [uncultured Mucilaginibacter sp.]
MQNKLLILVAAILLTGLALTSCGQAVVVPNGINFPKDSLIKEQLINSLNGLLVQMEQPASKNEFILKRELLETSTLMDEMKEMSQNVKLKDKDFYKFYLDNVVQLEDDNFLVQLCYIGITEGNPVFRAGFKLLAKKEDNKFYFYSPLKQNTRAWKSKTINRTTYHFKDTLNITDVKEYQKTLNLYDRKLKAPVYPTEFYYCDNLPEVLQLIGVDYKLDYNGRKNDNLTAHENNINLVLNGWTSNKYSFDPHDLWHERLRTVMNSEVINRPVDEGCAYLYGGSWGLTWIQVLTSFITYATAHPNANWEALYISFENYTNGDKPLKVPYAINALIVENIEKEKGFDAVMALLACGKRENGDANYFSTLEKITGVNRTSFNSYVWKLLKQHKLKM